MQTLARVRAQSTRIESWQKTNETREMFDCSWQLVLLWQFSSCEEAQSTENIRVGSHFHCFCISTSLQQFNNDATTPASPPPPAMTPPLQRPLSALVGRLPAVAAAPLPSQHWLHHHLFTTRTGAVAQDRFVMPPPKTSADQEEDCCC